MLFGLGIAILLGHAEVDDVDDIGGFGAGAADEEVVGFDVSINEVFLVNGLDAGKLHRVSTTKRQGIDDQVPSALLS